ncbi:hypothetical protein DESPIG_01950 [Desulfovibrio piger ATCC 29098]|uniref:Uncharacterized protein n=1 Tax=Desulfovibrio piger ATCC 29098 TaxID=411464 RepID=B6WV35_9BACT|nr:hypothetical protein DESPIG_01950 [Desulfovibrio piger ATCC 29098]
MPPFLPAPTAAKLGAFLLRIDSPLTGIETVDQGAHIFHTIAAGTLAQGHGLGEIPGAYAVVPGCLADGHELQHIGQAQKPGFRQDRGGRLLDSSGHEKTSLQVDEFARRLAHRAVW